MENEKILFDTDMDTDCDDAGALAMLLEYVKAGRAELLGIVTDAPTPYAAPCCEILTDFYKTDCPIGALSADFAPCSERLEKYRRHSAEWSLYNREISKPLCKTDRDYPSETEVYRRCLAAAPDNSVTVLCVGLLTSAANALMSEGDEISPLSGVELFKKKVKRVVSMGTPDKVGDFNWGMDREASESFFASCPAPIYVSQYGGEIITGKTLPKKFGKTHPVRRIYEIFARDNPVGRSSWDLIATLFAVEPDTPLFKNR